MERRWVAEAKSQYEDCIIERACQYWKCIEITILRICKCLGSVHARLWKDSLWSSGIAEDETESWNWRAVKKCYREVLQWPSLEQANHWAQEARANLLLRERLCERWESKIDLPIIGKERSGWHARTAANKTEQRRNHSETKTAIPTPEPASTSPKRSRGASET